MTKVERLGGVSALLGIDVPAGEGMRFTAFDGGKLGDDKVFAVFDGLLMHEQAVVGIEVILAVIAGGVGGVEAVSTKRHARTDDGVHREAAGLEADAASFAFIGEHLRRVAEMDDLQIAVRA